MPDPTRSPRLPGGGAVYSPSADHLVAVAQRELDRLAAVVRRSSCACDHTGPCKLHGQERDQLRAEVERLRADRDKCQRNEDEVGDRLEKVEAQVERLNQQIKDERAAMWSHLMDLLRLIDPEADPHYEEAYADLHAGITDLRERAEKAEAFNAEAGKNGYKLGWDERDAELKESMERMRDECNAATSRAEKAESRHAEAVALLRRWSESGFGVRPPISETKDFLAACGGKGGGG